MPGPFADLTGFHRLLIIRTLRPDRLTAELSKFVENQIGPEYTSQPPFDIRKAINESSPSTPIFFTLFPGVDPTRWVEDYAKNIANKEFLNISMGQGQEERAETSVHEFSERGGWIFLQNIHLMQAWLPRLEHTLEEAGTCSKIEKIEKCSIIVFIYTRIVIIVKILVHFLLSIVVLCKHSFKTNPNSVY